MQEDGTEAAETVVSSAGEEKKEDSETQAESSTVKGSISNEGVGGSETSIADRLDKTKELMKDFGKTVAIEKPKQMFADIQGMASNLKEKVAFNKPGDGESGEAAEKADPMEKPRQFFNGIKEKANSFSFSLNPPGAASNATSDADAELDVTSDEPAEAEGPKNDALERSKEFFTGVKEKASNFKIKMPLAGEEKFDEYGKPVPGPLDRMKADVKGLASGIREKMTTTNSRRAADNLDANTVDGSAVFTISEDHEEEDDGLLASRRSSMQSSEFSIRFNELVHSARSTANDSMSSMPSLASFYSTDTLPNFSEKFSSFRSTTIAPISEKLGMKTKQEPAFEEVEFFNASGTKLDYGPEPTIVKELSPEFKAKETSSEQKWENVSPSANKDSMPSMAHRNASMDMTAAIPPPSAADTTAVTVSEN